MVNRMRAGAAVAALLVLFGCSAGPAWAHARPERAVPADRSVVARPPSAVRVFFDEPVRPLPGTEAVRNDGGSILAGRAHLAPGNSRELVIPLRAGLLRGDYSVRWRIVSDDGRVIEGLLAFAVGAGSGLPEQALRLHAEHPGPLYLLARLFFYLGALVAFGAVAFRALAWRPALRACSLEHDERNAVAQRSRRSFELILGTALAIAVAGSSLVLALTPDAFMTRFGRAGALGLGIAAAGVVSILLARRWPRLLHAGSAAALVLPAIPAFSGHALDPGRPQPLSVVADLAHLAAAGVWLGGLLQLAFAVPWSSARLDPAPRGRVYAAVTERFSTLALASVATLGASGIARVPFELSAAHQLWTTGYGRALLAKTAMFSALLALGWVNRQRLVPSLLAAAQRNPGGVGAFARLRRSMLAEIALLAVLVAVVSLLTALRPGR